MPNKLRTFSDQHETSSFVYLPPKTVQSKRVARDHPRRPSVMCRVGPQTPPINASHSLHAFSVYQSGGASANASCTTESNTGRNNVGRQRITPGLRSAEKRPCLIRALTAIASVTAQSMTSNPVLQKRDKACTTDTARQ